MRDTSPRALEGVEPGLAWLAWLAWLGWLAWLAKTSDFYGLLAGLAGKNLRLLWIFGGKLTKTTCVSSIRGRRGTGWDTARTDRILYHIEVRTL